MKKFCLFLLILLFPFLLWAAGTGSLGVPGSGGSMITGETGGQSVLEGSVPCTGAFASGNTETFEKGAGQFCTSNITETDAGGVLSTYDNADKVTGVYSMSVTNSGSEVDSWIYGAAAGDDSNGDTIRFYAKFPSMTTSGYSLCPFSVKASNTAPTSAMATALRWYNNSGVFRLDIYDGAGSHYHSGPIMSANTWYRVEVQVKKNAGGSLCVYAIGSTSPVGGSCITDWVAANVDCDYWFIGQLDVNFAATHVVYFDNIKLVRGSMATVGPDE